MSYAPPRPGEYRDPGSPRTGLDPKAIQRRKDRIAIQSFVVALFCTVPSIMLSGLVEVI